MLPSTGFYDVQTDDYFAAPVAWARQNGITDGVTSTKFEPHWDCTNGQILTFLWRAAGSPAPGSIASFSDVPADAPYAVEKGITTGTSPAAFSPDQICSRAQIVTLLYRDRAQ